MTTDPLQIALAASRPLPASNAEACGELLNKPRRRVTVQDHQRFRETMVHPHRDDADLVDLLTELRAIERNHRE